MTAVAASFFAFPFPTTADAGVAPAIATLDMQEFGQMLQVTPPMPMPTTASASAAGTLSLPVPPAMLAIMDIAPAVPAPLVPDTTIAVPASSDDAPSPPAAMGKTVPPSPMTVPSPVGDLAQPSAPKPPTPPPANVSPTPVRADTQPIPAAPTPATSVASQDATEPAAVPPNPATPRRTEATTQRRSPTLPAAPGMHTPMQGPIVQKAVDDAESSSEIVPDHDAEPDHAPEIHADEASDTPSPPVTSPAELQPAVPQPGMIPVPVTAGSPLVQPEPAQPAATTPTVGTTQPAEAAPRTHDAATAIRSPNAPSIERQAGPAPQDSVSRAVSALDTVSPSVTARDPHTHGPAAPVHSAHTGPAPTTDLPAATAATISGVTAPLSPVAPPPAQIAAQAASRKIADTPSVSALPGHIGREMGVAVARHLATNGAPDTITVRLDPIEMGRIEVKLRFEQDGTLRAVVAADNPVALDLLRRDSADLGRALTDAGVRADAQTLRFDSRSAGDGNRQGGQPANPQQDARADRTTPRDTSAADDIPAPYRPFRTRGRVDLLT